MRKYVFLVLAILPFMVQAQKYACVNTDYILRSVPEYNQALNKINKYVSEWKSELEAKQQEVDELREQYQQEAYLLPDNLKQRRQDEIRTKETDLRRLQQQRFSVLPWHRSAACRRCQLRLRLRQSRLGHRYLCE